MVVNAALFLGLTTRVNVQTIVNTINKTLRQNVKSTNSHVPMDGYVILISIPNKDISCTTFLIVKFTTNELTNLVGGREKCPMIIQLTGLDFQYCCSLGTDKQL